MSIYVDKNTKVVVQGITGSHGSFHAKQMLAYGTRSLRAVPLAKVAKCSKSRCLFTTQSQSQ